MNRNELIEKAAKALVDDAWQGGVESLSFGDLTRISEVVFAVFEEANTPTIGCNICGEALPDGEPHVCAPGDESEALAIAKILHRADCGCDQEQDAHDEPYWSQARALTGCGCSFHRTVQGEPSDAQVDAALDAFHGRSDWSNVADVGHMRAALRAAAETGGGR